MHKSAHDQMALCVTEYLPADRRHRVVDLGSRISDGQSRTHRELLAGHDIDYVGVDVQDGPNVDAVMTRPYRIPVKSRSADCVISGQAFEHIPFFWASMLEIARILKPGGLAFITAPSRGHVHDAQDCWRYYPDGFRAMAAYSGLRLREAYTDFPPMRGIRHDYAAIDAKNAYWGDSVGVFQKPPRTRARSTAAAFAVRELTVWWANRVGGVDRVPLPRPLEGRVRQVDEK
ncbi:class I SAM-dependent methyltransferase [Streptomyces sp. A3M-1-3]|uniref:methyltransferase domain-containing protein n=1 Tax=Streptomyces sp. A3M-1-3 TaxID=2962044 RepID=UPI0020B82DBE|nr:methyltransferase domain-containing protein [Streptomyces sp. A3M-1-3]MCP3822166.1 class I SAM-dependent methyltransferase [Streptomyces sp. A3M-1-3]